MNFSERVGARPPVKLLALNQMSQPLRTAIWNLIVESIPVNFWTPFARRVARDARQPVDAVPGAALTAKLWFREQFFGYAWFEVYEMLELAVEVIPNITTHTEGDVRLVVNALLERDGSPYRLNDQGRLIPITSVDELAAIAEATGSRDALEPARGHLRTASGLLAQRPQPDYANCVKESTAAIESCARILGADTGTGLVAPLAELEKRMGPLHPALHTALVKLYAWASSESGIRHGSVAAPNVGFEEAKLALVTCSALLNFLAAKAREAGFFK